MASLYEIREDLLAVIDGCCVFDEETGEVIFDEDNLEELQASYYEKLEGCGIYLKQLDYDISAYKAEEKSLSERRKALERKRERFCDYVMRNLDSKLDTPKVMLSKRRSTFVDVIDEDALPMAFKREKVTVTPDKTAIKNAIGLGEVVPGAVMSERESLVVK